MKILNNFNISRLNKENKFIILLLKNDKLT